MGKSLKFIEKSEQTLSPGSREYRRLLSVLAWTVRWMIWYTSTCRNKRKKVAIQCFTLQKRIDDSGKTFILYRTQMLRLLAFPKPTFDQLAIELPCLMGFRAKEVCTWRAEYVDFQNMNTFVMDAKKKKLFTLPLNLYVAGHTETILNGRSEGCVLVSRSTRNMGDELTPFAIWHIWDKWTKEAKLPNAKDISPVTGRRFFAAEWFYSQGLSLVTLQMILRHIHFETTMRYVRSLVFYEDVKKEYDKFQFKVMEDLKKKEVYA